MHKKVVSIFDTVTLSESNLKKYSATNNEWIFY